MSMVEKLRVDAKQALRDGDEVKKNILRLAIGEIETLQGRTGKDLTDEQCEKILRKLVADNEETLEVRPNPQLVLENEILQSFLPQQLTIDEIREKLVDCEGVADNPNFGQAIGTAINLLRGHGFSVDGKDVTTVVREIHKQV